MPNPRAYEGRGEYDSDSESSFPSEPASGRPTDTDTPVIVEEGRRQRPSYEGMDRGDDPPFLPPPAPVVSFKRQGANHDSEESTEPSPEESSGSGMRRGTSLSSSTPSKRFRFLVLVVSLALLAGIGLLVSMIISSGSDNTDASRVGKDFDSFQDPTPSPLGSSGWYPLGESLQLASGPAAMDISSNGLMLAVGDPQDPTNGQQAGAVQVYRYSGSTTNDSGNRWLQNNCNYQCPSNSSRKPNRQCE